MKFRLRLASALLIPLAAWSAARADTGDVVGYVSTNLVPGTKGALAVCLVKDYANLGTVTAVGPDYIEYASDLPEHLMGTGGSAFLEIRTGAGAGTTLPVTGFSGKRVSLAASPAGLVAPGNQAGVRPDWTLGELFTDPITSGIEAGDGPETADLIGMLDPTTREIRSFYYKTGAGWREAGREDEGDKATVAVPFPCALLYHRRGTLELRFFNMGAVPMPYIGSRKVFVRPGRNLLTGPFTSVERLDDWITAATLVAGDSAPRSDSLRMIYPEGGESPVAYFRQGEGWRQVGGSGSAGETRVDMYQAVDFQRVGPAGYVEFMGIQAPSAKARQLPEKTVAIDHASSDFAAGTIAWASEPGKRYQLQIQPGGEAWQDHGPLVTADSSIARATCRPDGRGLIRILEKP